MKGSQEEDLRNRALCIIAAKPEEVAVFRHRFGLTECIAGSKIPSVSNSHQFWLGSFLAGNGEQLPFYLTCCSRQGIQTFSIESTALFTALKPKYAIHIGVCAGRASKDVEIGQVIFGQTALNYEEGKHVVKDKARIFQPSADPIRYRDVGVAAFVKSANKPKEYKYGTFASGCSVRTDAQDILKRLADTVERDVLALEMEASAFLHTCKHTGVISLGVVKGVSDLGDENKVVSNENDYNAALVNTAKAVKHWIGEMPDTITPLPRRGEPGLVLAEGYCLNYIGPVWYGKDDLWTRTGKIEGGAEGLKIVLPDNNNVTRYSRGDVTIPSSIRKRGLVSVCAGEGNEIRTTLYKEPYMIDFPRDLAT